MKIFIPSYKRAQTLLTRFSVSQMPQELLKDVTLVVREEERKAYEKVTAGLVTVHGFEPPPELHADGFFGAASTYDYIIGLAIERKLERIILMDDDLVFSSTVEEPFSWGDLLERMAGADMDAPVYSVDNGLDLAPAPEGELWSERAHIARFYCLYTPFFKKHPEYRFTMRDERGAHPRYQPDYWLLCHLYNAGYKSMRYNGILQEHIEGADGGENATGRTSRLVHDSFTIFTRKFPYVWATPATNVRDYRDNWWKEAKYGERELEARFSLAGSGGASWEDESFWADPSADNFWARFWFDVDIEGLNFEGQSNRLYDLLYNKQEQEQEPEPEPEPKHNDAREIRLPKKSDFDDFAEILESFAPYLSQTKMIGNKLYCWDNEKSELAEVKIMLTPLDLQCCKKEVLRAYIAGD